MTNIRERTYSAVYFGVHTCRRLTQANAGRYARGSGRALSPEYYKGQ